RFTSRAEITAAPLKSRITSNALGATLLRIQSKSSIWLGSPWTTATPTPLCNSARAEDGQYASRFLIILPAIMLYQAFSIRAQRYARGMSSATVWLLFPAERLHCPMTSSFHHRV